VPFEILNLSFMLLGLFPRLERSKISPLAGLRIFLSGIEAVFSCLQSADHGEFLPQVVMHVDDQEVSGLTLPYRRTKLGARYPRRFHP